MIHLDTNLLIRGLARGTPQDGTLRGWLRSGESLGMSTIAWAELLCGPIETRHLELATASFPNGYRSSKSLQHWPHSCSTKRDADEGHWSIA